MVVLDMKRYWFSSPKCEGVAHLSAHEASSIIAKWFGIPQATALWRLDQGLIYSAHDVQIWCESTRTNSISEEIDREYT